MICKAEEKDIPWLLDLAKQCYPAFDVTTSENWLKTWMGKENIIIVRGDHSAAVALVTCPFWSGEKECELEFICSKKSRLSLLEIIELVKYIDELRKNIGCKRFYINSRLADLGPIALRLGAQLVGKTYKLGE